MSTWPPMRLFCKPFGEMSLFFLQDNFKKNYWRIFFKLRETKFLHFKFFVWITFFLKLSCRVLTCWQNVARKIKKFHRRIFKKNRSETAIVGHIGSHCRYGNSFSCWLLDGVTFLTLSAPIVPYSMLLCLTPDDFTCQGGKAKGLTSAKTQYNVLGWLV